MSTGDAVTYDNNNLGFAQILSIFVLKMNYDGVDQFGSKIHSRVSHRTFLFGNFIEIITSKHDGRM